MELRDQRPRPTLAQKLGDVTHVSPLLRKVRGERLSHWSRFVSQSGVTAFGGGPRIDRLSRGTGAL